MVCLGDSWTWGDSLGDTFCQDKKYNTEYRTSVFFGTILSKLLDSDLVNLAKPAASNWHIYNNLKNFLADFPLNNYKKIVCVITLTENFRELEDPTSWPVRDFSKECNSLHDLIVDYEQRMFSAFKELFDCYPAIDFRVGRNFTYTRPENISILPHLDKTWVDIIGLAQNIESYNRNTVALSDLGIYPLLQYLRDNNLEKQYLEELDQLVTKSLDAISWLEKSKLNKQSGTKHPTEEAHRLWAEYIYSQL